MKNTMVKGIAATALTTGALALGTGMANAAPATKTKPAPLNPHRISAGIAPGVTYTGDSKTGGAQIVTPWGTVSTAKGQWGVSDAKGKAVFGNPKATVMKPERPSASNLGPVPGMPAAARPAADEPTKKKPLTAAEKEEAIYASIGTVGTHFGLAYGVGAMVGGVAGAVVGCPIGMFVLAPVTTTIPIAGPILSCVVGAGTIGTTGAILGGAVVAVPVGIASTAREIARLQENGAL